MTAVTLNEPEKTDRPDGATSLEWSEANIAGSNADATDASLPGHITRQLVGGTSTLGLGIVIERGFGFTANILAARLAGASTFGAYSLAISTANNISTYAAGGIGSTAARFSGKYPYQSRGYTTLARALVVVSISSALLGALALSLGAGPIAHLLHKTDLTSLLRWAGLSAAGIILLECARGFFLGQRRFAALLLLSGLVGLGMIILLPLAASMHSPTRMIVLQGSITSLAVGLCLLLARPLNLRSSSGLAPLPLAPVLREVWGFGLVQLAGLVGSNLAGWWLITLVARTDTTLIQMSFFAIASQLRNVVGLAPSLLTESSYAVMSDDEEEHTPHRVMAICTFASFVAVFLLAGLGITALPFVLPVLYGVQYHDASITVAIALATAVVHMGNAPAAARLSIVSVRSLGVINTVWAIFVATTASLLLFHDGSAWEAMAIYFFGHILSSALVLITLAHKDHLPSGVVALTVSCNLAIAVLATLAIARGHNPSIALMISGLMTIFAMIFGGILYLFGRRFHWLPSGELVRSLTTSLRSRLSEKERHV